MEKDSSLLEEAIRISIDDLPARSSALSEDEMDLIFGGWWRPRRRRKRKLGRRRRRRRRPRRRRRRRRRRRGRRRSRVRGW